jgi:DNA modification methylase
MLPPPCFRKLFIKSALWSLSGSELLMARSTALPLGDPPPEPTSNPLGLVPSWSGRVPSGKTWSVFEGDAREVLTHLSKDSFQCVVTSPPYFWQRDYDVAGQIGLEPDILTYVNAICETMDAVRDVMDKTGLLFLNLGDTYYSAKGKPQGSDKKHGGRRLKVLRAVDTIGLGVPKKTIIGMPWRVALEMISRGWILRSPIIWKRDGNVPESSARDRPWRTHEMLFMFSKSRTYYFSRKKLAEYGEEDVWTIPTRSKAGRIHTAVFPPALVQRCLEIGCGTGGSVLDPFAGSGTVLKVALELGHDTVGIDLNQSYCQMMASELASNNLKVESSA